MNHTYTENGPNWIEVQIGEPLRIPCGFYVFSDFNEHQNLKNFKIDDPSNRFYCLETPISGDDIIGRSVSISTTSSKKTSMKKVHIVEKFEEYGYEMSNKLIMDPSTAFVCFVHYPCPLLSKRLMKMVLYKLLLNDPDHYIRLADQIKNDACSELAVASVDNTIIFEKLSQWNRSDDVFYKGSSEEILKKRAKDVHILELIERHAKEEQKRNEERAKKEKQERHDEYLRQCEHARRLKIQEEYRRREEEFNRKNETKCEENEYHYQPTTYSRKR